MMKTPRLLLALLLVAISCARALTPDAPEVPLTTAKALAYSVAAERLAEPRLAGARLYRNLDDAPAVWVLEYHSATNDNAYTVVAAATRSLPPIVMHWDGLPWHADPDYLARARAAVGAYRRVDAKADWQDLRWEGPLDLWVPRTDANAEQTFAGLRTEAELTRPEVAALAAQRAAFAAARAVRVSPAWADLDRHAAQVLSSQPPVAATPQYGYTRYLSRVPYLNQTTSPDCGIVSMMDILLYHDANGFPALVNEADLAGLRLRLRTLMEWTTEGTYANMQMNGTRAYVAERGVTGFTFGYHARANYRDTTSTDMSFSQYTSEIDAGRPVQVNLQGYTRTNVTDADYGGHATCGVGYYSGSVAGVTRAAWAIIHDNWKGSFTDPYQNPPEPYVDYSMVNSLIKVVPPAAAPVAASSLFIDAPTNNSTVNLGATANLTARITTASGVTASNVTFKVDNTVLRTTSTPDGNQPANRTGTTYSTAWTPSAAGSYTLTVTAVDSLNRSLSASASVTVPSTNAPPVIGWSAPQYENAQLLTNNATSLSVAASDNDGAVSSVEFLLVGAGSSTSLGRVTPTSGTTFITLPGVTFTTTGSFTLRAIATDNRGATATADRRVEIVAGAASNNDTFAGATLLAAAGEVVSTRSTTATRESGEPSHAGDAGGRSLWWKWTPGAGTAVLATRGSSFDTLLGVYTGPAIGSLSPVASNDDDADSSASYVRFSATAGTTYYVAVDGYNGASGDITLTALHSSGASPNDSFASRTTLSGTSTTAIGNSIAASTETGEPRHAGGAGGRSLWWTWTAPDNGNLSLSTAGSTFDTLLGVYTGSAVGTLGSIASNDDSGPNYTSALTTAVTKGTAYQIAVDGYGGANGRVKLALTFAASTANRPANDAFASRTPIAGSNASLNASSVGATRETGEPNHAGSTGGASLWWSWTAPSDGTLSLSTAGSDFDTVLGVYTGTSLNVLSLVGSDDDSGDSRTSRLAVTVRAGTAYQIAVDGYARASGNVLLYLNFAGGTAPAAPTTSRLINVATRGQTGSGSSTMVAGFAITGSTPKSVLIRAVGPTLRGYGLSNAITDPVLSLYLGSTRIATNDNWEDNPSRALIADKSTQAGAFALSAGAKDAVILTTLAPGNYTAMVTAAPGTSSTGVGMVEVYDADVAADADATGRRLINLSTRGFVGTGDDVMIAGLVVSGTSSKRVLIRGIGNTLATFGVTGVLFDAMISVYRGSTLVASNDDWGLQAAANVSAILAATGQVGAFPLPDGSSDSVLLLTLTPGAYSIKLSGFLGVTGVGMIEAYELP